MARGGKKSFSNKQRRLAHHVEQGYEKKGFSRKAAERLGWATANKYKGTKN